MKHQGSEGKHRKAWLVVLAVILPLVLLLALSYVLLFGYNRFSLELELQEGDQMTLEYGTHFLEPGFRVFLRGTRFLQSGIELDRPVEISGSVNEQKLGKYVLDYRTDFLGMEAEALRVVRVVDTISPVITLVPDEEDLEAAPEYREAGFSAYDNHDGDITSLVVRRVEEGKVTYQVTDSSGNPASAERQIPIFDQAPPELTLIGGDRVELPMGLEFADPGYVAIDKKDGDLTDRVTVTIDHPYVRYLPDSYQLTYQVADSDGRQSTVSRTLVTQPSPRPRILYPKGKTIYLTFDDGPGPDTARLLDILKRYDVSATFFVVDTGYPDLLQRMVNEGHSVGIHTCSHLYSQIYSSEEAYFEDLFAMQEKIQEATGVETWLLRFPGGSSNTISRKNKGIMKRLTQAVEDCGFSYFDWNVDSGDASDAQTPGAVFENVTAGVGENTYSVVLMHDIHSYSVDAVERIIRWGLKNGYRFLPLQTDSPAVHHVVQN